MRVFSVRFALGLGLFTTLFAVADVAQAGPLQRLRARRAGAVYSTPVAYAPAGYAGGYSVGYGQPSYGAVDPCCPQTGAAYGGVPAGGAYGGAYGGAMTMPSPHGIHSAGGIPSYYTPGGAT